jgi:hypothetical protein
MEEGTAMGEKENAKVVRESLVRGKLEDQVRFLGLAK